MKGQISYKFYIRNNVELVRKNDNSNAHWDEMSYISKRELILNVD